jgi:hypothetical protein
MNPTVAVIASDVADYSNRENFAHYGNAFLYADPVARYFN